MIIVFTCNRPKMLLKNLKYLDKFDQDIVVLDDYSDYNIDPFLEYADYYRTEEKLGRERYWHQWKLAFMLCAESDDDLFIFMPDDFLKLNYKKIVELHEYLKHRSYSYNLINDGRTECFRQFTPKETSIEPWETLQIGFNDCGFFCNRKTLKLLNFRFDPVNPLRFVNNPYISSGVGQQLTMRMRDNGVFMLMPEKSLAFHGDHPSVMHGIERVNNPLISK